MASFIDWRYDMYLYGIQRTDGCPVYLGPISNRQEGLKLIASSDPGSGIDYIHYVYTESPLYSFYSDEECEQQ